MGLIIFFRVLILNENSKNGDEFKEKIIVIGCLIISCDTSKCEMGKISKIETQ